jgi:membrane protease YdiL (CAAX protease family)
VHRGHRLGTDGADPAMELTKNIWVSTGAHIINDWMLFLMALLGAGLVGKV